MSPDDRKSWKYYPAFRVDHGYSEAEFLLFVYLSSKDNIIGTLTLNLKETPFNTFANRADQDQAALTRSA